MNNTPGMAMKTETKVAIGMLVLTVAIIVGGAMLFGGKSATTGPGTDISKYIQTDIAFDKTDVSPSANPKVTGTTATYKGTSTAPIVVTEFMDYECPACATIGEPLVRQMLSTYGSRITITRRILPIHGQPAIMLARMVLAAQDVSPEAYEKLHAKVLETQSTWAILGTSERVGYFKKLTAEIGLDYDTLVKVGNEKYASQIDKDQEDATKLGIRATPSFILNNKTRITGGIPLEAMNPYMEQGVVDTK